MNSKVSPPGIETVLRFPLFEALYGRRSRRFPLGASIPEGQLKFSSAREPHPLSDLEQMIILSTMAGNTGWHYMIAHHARYAPHLPNYSCAAGGRVFPSAAGFHTSDIFFTDDQGVYFFSTRDAPDLVEREPDGTFNLNAAIEPHRKRVRKLSDGRLHIPAEEPYLSGHNTWCVNRPGSMLIIPVSDVAQHLLAFLCFLVQNGYCVYDDLNSGGIPGIERFRHLVNVDNPYPMTYIEQYALIECAAEISTCCYAGMLMLQAMGLGGWMFDGIDRHALLGASGNPQVPGLGFRYDANDRWAIPNPTGKPGVFEGYCPPHYSDMRSAVEALAQRKFGPGGPYHPDTQGPWKETAKIRGSAEVYGSEFKECVGLMAQYIYDRFGKFPGTVPTILTLTYLQAHHLDLDFYNHYFKDGAYLQTHARHMDQWHGDDEQSTSGK